MTKKEIIRRMEQAERLAKLGLTVHEAETIRRISCQLSRWCEAECNGEIQRDESNRPRRYPNPGMSRFSYPIADRENGAIKRLEKIIASHPSLAWYYQGDPRGASVYIYRPETLAGRPIDSYYSSIGIAVW